VQGAQQRFTFAAGVRYPAVCGPCFGHDSALLHSVRARWSIFVNL
jgi:hypothetical protein